MAQDFLPPEFQPIEHLVSYVQKKSANEFSASCPQCGGSPHKNGDFPDRFVMWRVGRHGFPMGMCRKCGYKWWEKANKPTKEDVEYWRQQQIEVEKARIEAAKRSIEFLQNDRVWQKFYENNNEWSRNLLRERGIEDSWIDYLRLGLLSDYIVWHGGENYHSPAQTIPVWGVGGVVQNIKMRVLNPRSGADRYRNFYSIGNSFAFVPMYDLPLKGTGVVVEGEFKAIIMQQKLDQIDVDYRVVGLQSKTPDSSVVECMKDLDCIYLWLDPDAHVKENVAGKNPKFVESAVEYVTRILGKERVRVVYYQEKCDDGIVKYGLDPKRYFAQARKP